MHQSSDEFLKPHEIYQIERFRWHLPVIVFNGESLPGQIMSQTSLVSQLNTDTSWVSPLGWKLSTETLRVFSIRWSLVLTKTKKLTSFSKFTLLNDKMKSMYINYDCYSKHLSLKKYPFTSSFYSHTTTRTPTLLYSILLQS